TAFFTIFSFAFLIPILQMLFGIETGQYTYMEPGSAPLKEWTVNNFYYYTSLLIDAHGRSFTLGCLAATLVVMTLLKVGVYYLSEYFIIPLKNGVERDLRNTMYNKILSLPIGFFTSEHKGDILARISGDVTEIDTSVLTSVLALIRYPVMILFCLAVMIYVSWQLTIFVFILLPIVGLVLGAVGKKLKASSLQAQNLWGDILSTTEETISGLRIVKAFNAENTMRRHFESETDEYFRLTNRVNRRVSLAHPLSEFLGTAAIALLLWFGGSLIISGDSTIDAAGFIYYMVIFYSIINPAKELSKASYTVRKGEAALTRIDRILAADNPIKDPANPTTLPDKGPESGHIKFDNVSFAYTPGQEVLRNINLDIRPGMTVAVIGQSGAGKSTLADMIPRFWDVDRGSVTVDGIDVRQLRVTDLRSLIGNVSQEAILFNDSFFNNIAFGSPDATREEVEQAARIANAHDFIMETPDGYDTIVGDRGSRLSGGQRQRISIARAVLKNPPILILDEATSALDTESERLVQQALERLMADRTTIIIAHRLSTITNADLICVLNNGEIVERGTHQQLMDLNGLYHRLVTLQQV
ncbi:MAG: ABC transporter ATP-binding protein/permease, partial [Muribaculaceae bacterium]|nr:ABC transporter ATP-binding protein/permease [Muribaculaceae bacterium]